MGGVFAANMTGNTVLAGIDIAKGDQNISGERSAATESK